jgi:hypothetical protein
MGRIGSEYTRTFYVGGMMDMVLLNGTTNYRR